MKTISKILYSIISFSVFVAYKVSTAYSATTIKLTSYTLMTTSTSEDTCKTVCKNAGITSTAIAIKNEIWSRLQTPDVNITLCNAGSYLGSCIINNVSISNTSANLSSLTSCTASNAQCYACPKFNDKSATAPSSRLTRWTPKTYTLCSTHNLTKDAALTYNYSEWVGKGTGIETYQNGKCVQQEYAIVENTTLSASDIYDCYVPENTTINDGTGDYNNTTSCPYKK